ncbi:Eco57I restriction-modification methylase domain-containing protein [Treponema primitia]|uniref:Eco57I restriction-modification methylase domain-containing protein n=1 Tax=Treponema primitia TaxID=88058 RepID=UPI0002555133|nr:N-6 DNA methylase [Treponema primitia]
MPDFITQIKKIGILVETYESHYEQYHRSTYNETEVRVDFVNPLFQALGWDVLNERRLPQHLREVKHEANVVVEEAGESRKKRPDYCFRAGTESCFFLETKKPAVDIKTATEPAFQLRRYGWSGNLSVSILTNFTDLLIYDCSIRPLENDPANKALVAHYHYTDYADKFEEIFSLISKDAVVSGIFADRFSNINSSLMKEPFDDYFLNQIRRWRNVLSQDLLINNSYLNTEELNIFVQKILNRIVFLRICEDRSFEQFEALKAITTYPQLKELFIIADRKYDSGLFDLIDEQTLIISDNVIVDIFRDLYYPNGSYEFSVVDPYIIGQIYEIFLIETITITEDGSISCEEKPEAVDSQGTVNTPKNIADFIVEETLLQLFYGKTPDEISSYHIADICCGSGNFLVSAFEYIVNHYIEYYKSVSLDDYLHRGFLLPTADVQTFNLSYAIKRQILINNIFGVDIDALATEVTKLSLLLKLLENVSVDELDEYILASRQKALPDLSENIKNGNSLIDSTYTEFNSAILEDMSLLAKIKMFDWDHEFKHTTFDAIIGNPPYIRVQKMVHYSPEEYRYYKADASVYETASAELLDKYYLFIERALSLLSNKGFLGYIVPHRFMNTKSGVTLRKWLSERKVIKKVAHFGTHQVFPGRSTYTCVIILTVGGQETFEIGFVDNWSKFLFDHTTIYDTYKSSVLSTAPWTFIPGSIKAALKKVSQHCVRLDALTEIFVGVQTSADTTYIIHQVREDNKYVYFTDKDDRPQKVEKQILKKSIYDCKIKKYESICHNTYIIFPYKAINGKPVLYTIGEMIAQFPCAYHYLYLYKDELAVRNMPNRTESNWYAYGRSQSIQRFFSGEHLIWPVLSTDSNYVFDDEVITFTGGGNGPYYGLLIRPDTQMSIFYIQALLNFWLMEYIVKASASTFRGDYYSHGKQFVASLPIYKIDFSNPNEARSHAEIVQDVRGIMELSKKKNVAKTKAEKSMLDRAVITRANRIESVINSFYEVTNDAQVNL